MSGSGLCSESAARLTMALSYAQVAHLALFGQESKDESSSAAATTALEDANGDTTGTENTYSYDAWVMSALSQPLGAAAYLALLKGLPVLGDAAIGPHIHTRICLTSAHTCPHVAKCVCCRAHPS